MSDITFISYDTNALVARVVAAVEAQLGRTLAPSDPVRLVALALAYELAVTNGEIDFTGQQNLLRYAGGDYLDALGDLFTVTRRPAEAASATLRFAIVSPQVYPTVIPVGTRVKKPGTDLYYATRQTATILAGLTLIDVPADCTAPGLIGNGVAIGGLTELVDQLAYVVTVTNLEETAGGSDVETDDSLRARIRLAPTALSVAGTEDAYEFFTRSARADIEGVTVTSPSPRVIDIRFTLTGGEIPGEAIIAEVLAYISDPARRAMSDLVSVDAPTETEYSVDISYYIDQVDALRAVDISAAVELAVAEWIAWQRAAIGRDVNPSELIHRVMNAGVKRVELRDPAYAAIPADAIAVIDTAATIVYGGLEDV